MAPAVASTSDLTAAAFFFESKSMSHSSSDSLSPVPPTDCFICLRRNSSRSLRHFARTSSASSASLTTRRLEGRVADADALAAEAEGEVACPAPARLSIDRLVRFEGGIVMVVLESGTCYEATILFIILCKVALALDGEGENVRMRKLQILSRYIIYYSYAESVIGGSLDLLSFISFHLQSGARWRPLQLLRSSAGKEHSLPASPCSSLLSIARPVFQAFVCIIAP